MVKVLISLLFTNFFLSDVASADGLGGYDIALTRRGSRVRVPIGVFFLHNGHFLNQTLVKRKRRKRRQQGSNLRARSQLISSQPP
jgi:hypothetical protein